MSLNSIIFPNQCQAKKRNHEIGADTFYFKYKAITLRFLSSYILKIDVTQKDKKI